jgi:hypothetical protein
MPSWKKVIVSGSDASLNSLNVATNVVAQSFTGSLFGTASFAVSSSHAIFANSSSYALTASYVNPLSQTVIISGSTRFDPTQDPDPTGLDLDSTYLFQSSSNTSLGYDLYFRQNGNLVKWKWIEGSLESGLLYGGVVTYSGSNVFVSSGSGIIVDHNATTGSETSPIVDYVTWGPITQSIVNITSSQVTYLYIDDTGALQQQGTRFTSEQYHNYIPLGAVGHFDYTNVNAFGGAVRTSYDQVSQLSDFVDAFGPLKVSGYGITGQSGSLQISVTSGRSFVHGGFYPENPEFPSNFDTNSQATASIAYLYRSGSGIEFDTNSGNLYTALRPGFYDDGSGTPATVPGGSYTIQRVFSDPKTGVLYIYYGQNQYVSISQALTNLSTDSFTEGDTFDFTTFLGFIIAKSNTTDITNTSDAKIIPAGLFRGSGGGSGGGGGAEALDDLSDVTIISPVNGQALVYDSGIWQNGYPTSASFATSASQAQNAVTASYVLNAVSASYATNALSASYSATASSVIGTVESASYAFTASILQNSSAKISSSAIICTSGSTLLYDLSAFKGAMVDYVVSTSGSGASARAGTFTSTWNSVFSTFNEATTMDIGNTDAVSFSADSTGSIFVNVTTGSWEVDSLYRALGTAAITSPPAPTSITVNFYSTGTSAPLVGLTCASTSSYSVQIFGDPGNNSPTFCGPDELLAIDITNILAGGHSIPVGSTFYLSSGGQVRTWIRQFDNNLAYWYLDSCQACPATTTTTTTTSTTTTTTIAPNLFTHGTVLATCSDYCNSNYNIATPTVADNNYASLTIGDTIYGQGGVAGYVAYANSSTDTTTGPFKVAQIDSSGVVIGITECSGGSCVPV